MAEELLPPARLRTYDFVYGNGPVTARQVDDALGRDYHKRLPELLAQGVLVQVGTTTCPVSHQQVYLWDITDRLPVPFKKPKPAASTLTGRAKAIAEIEAAIPVKKRSPELLQLLQELEPAPDNDAPEAMFRG